jgi:hypothetical protein
MKFDLHDLYKANPRVFIAVAVVIAAGFALLVVKAVGTGGHHTGGPRSAQVTTSSTSTTTSGSTPTTPSGVTVPNPNYHPTYQSVPQTPALEQIETNLGGLSAQSVAAAEALSPPAAAWSTAYPAIPTSVRNDANGYAIAFADELLDRNYRDQTRSELLAWSQAEAAAELFPGIPKAVAPKGLYVSLTEPSLADLTASPLPTAGQWSADARAGMTQSVYSVLANPDAQWGTLVSKGFQSDDPLMTMYDVTGVLTTKDGKASRTQHFTLVLGLGSALDHPGFGAFSIAEWELSS